ncbi:MAG TPA: hypothetical protein DCS01_06480 [Idiomarina abyssalis]|nr:MULTISPECIES: site-specific integrase [Idiomarina]MAB21619.1 hypothetical protein [Idiomarina sp.]MBH93705.1 hypothetical protein [Idiomarina sp.]HAS14929.1 hypothetical protein [Idiomarina abyssalis]|tara:strand:+ start:11578 stop:12951 length:1374 start_codon:yes stop_codon:yes gene_type:complete
MTWRKRKYQGKHQLKNLKRTQNSPYRLTRQTLSDLSSFLLAEADQLPYGIALASILSGRTFSSLTDPDIPFELLESGAGKLFSRWHYGQASSPLFDNAEKLVNCDSPYILLPPCAASAIAKAREQAIPASELEHQFSLPSPLKRGPSGQLITLNAIKRVIDYERTKVGITRYERDFIADREMNENMQNFYAAFSARLLHERHADFMDLFLPEHEVDVCRQHAAPHSLLFGSKKALSCAGVQSISSALESAFKKSLRESDHVAIHNIYTLYVLNTLQLATMHRPAPDAFRGLNTFCHDFEQVEIVDKSVTSTRLVPVCKYAQKLLKEYIDYLRCYQARFRFTNPAKYHAIGDMLSGRSNLFRIQTATLFLPDIENLPEELGDDVFNKINWHRHTMASRLIIKSVDRDALSAFMGHRQALDNPTSAHSTLCYDQLLTISEHINKILHTLSLPHLSPGRR